MCGLRALSAGQAVSLVAALTELNLPVLRNAGGSCTGTLSRVLLHSATWTVRRTSSLTPLH
jgi:hypothetical protein